MKNFLFFLLILVSLQGFSQNHRPTEISLFSQNQVSIRSEIQQMFGANLEWNIYKNISLNYSLRLGSDQEGNFYFQCPVGMLASGLLLGSIFGDNWEILGVLIACCLVPEGVSYNISNEDFFISPYINPALIEFSNYGVNLAGECGVKIKCMLHKRWFATANVGLQTTYWDYRGIKPYFGMSLGWGWN